ncbi:aminotransferase [Desulfuromonas acetoxidans]|uniref:Aminotransferase n=1 Tax=Desulfuromonas acetoxidans (strain DSM 684 / 11070) TaxID=281689 RepID=Q1JXK6_DESA6|nr:aminotransferase [Desulfuromonas acetoxidans]EAT14956.1 aminotransferase, class I and II [Desulfuromonas acetoxidans DSM 684]MBF0644699.1 aminotransferase [Desulfuromonas acetoxidans]NVD25300.1 aminotransferase [Desulfuromonas acetoxidans]NVE17296.1 aminotransferase [Desulfuromonas acetoxidans]
MKRSSRLDAVTFPPITEVKGWLAGRDFPADKPLVDLCQAIPDYPPHDDLVAHVQQRMGAAECAVYSPDEGLLETRESVSRWYQRRCGHGPTPAQLCLTIGASQAFWLTLLLLCEDGDEVIVQLPAYFDHPMGMEALGIVPRYVPFDAEPEAFAEAVNARTRAILMVTPSNPTGAILSPKKIDALYELACRHDIALVLDETYHAFVPSGQAPHTLFSRSDWPQNLIHFASFGKTFALTGYRAGCLVADESLIRQALKVQDSMVVCQPRVTQYAVAYGCDNLDDWVAENNHTMQQRHDLFCRLFAEQNAFDLCASGAFFAWVRHPWPQMSGRQAARRLVDHAHVACLPGEVFGPGLEGYLRLAFGNVRLEQIPMAVDRFKQVDSTL